MQIKEKEGIEQGRPAELPEGTILMMQMHTDGLFSIATKGEVWLDADEMLEHADMMRRMVEEWREVRRSYEGEMTKPAAIRVLSNQDGSYTAVEDYLGIVERGDTVTEALFNMGRKIEFTFGLRSEDIQ